jgi:hypothetical protein
MDQGKGNTDFGEIIIRRWFLWRIIMKEYKIFEHPDGKVEVVKQGWSWPGFLFAFFWLLAKRMWIPAGIIFASFLLIVFIGGVAGGAIEKALDEILSIANIMIMVVFGIKGNNLREKNLLSRGFDFRTTLTASNHDGAVAIYLKERQAK